MIGWFDLVFGGGCFKRTEAQIRIWHSPTVLALEN